MSEQISLMTSTGDSSLSPDAELNEPDFRAPPSRCLEIATASIALALSALAFYFAYNIELRMDPGGINARWWPSVLSITASLLSAIMLVASMTINTIDRGDVEVSNADGWSRMLKALALSSLYVFAWSQIGYFFPTLAYLVALLWIFGLRNFVAMGLYSLVTTSFIYGLFHYMLRVPL
jgi:hypothetical protein